MMTIKHILSFLLLLILQLGYTNSFLSGDLTTDLYKAKIKNYAKDFVEEANASGAGISETIAAELSALAEVRVNKIIEATDLLNLISKLDNFPSLRLWVSNLDEVADVNLINRLDDLGADYWGKLNTDLASISSGDKLKTLLLSTDLVEVWKALDNIGIDDAIRKNPSYLKNVDDYAKRSGKSSDEVADLAKNNENGIEQFLDELEDTPASGHWDENPFRRGKLIEDDLGQNLPETFKTIDKYNDVTGEVTSIKSLDLDAKTYQTPSKLRARLNKYVDQLDAFDQHTQELVTVGDDLNPVNSKTLELAIPRAATGDQLNIINEVTTYAANKGINFKVIVFP